MNLQKENKEKIQPNMLLMIKKYAKKNYKKILPKIYKCYQSIYKLLKEKDNRIKKNSINLDNCKNIVSR